MSVKKKLNPAQLHSNSAMGMIQGSNIQQLNYGASQNHLQETVNK